MRAILESSTDYAIIATDLDGRVTQWNEGARLILRWDEAEMLGELAHAFFTDEESKWGNPSGRWPVRKWWAAPSMSAGIADGMGRDSGRAG